MKKLILEFWKRNKMKIIIFPFYIGYVLFFCFFLGAFGDIWDDLAKYG